MTDVNVRISAAESVIMQALWRRAPLSAEEILAETGDGQNWTEGTVKKLLNRLLTKGAVRAERDGRRFLYHPAVEREAYVSAESQNLLDRLFDGRVSSLVSHFSQRENLSDEDIAELKRLIGKLENDR